MAKLQFFRLMIVALLATNTVIAQNAPVKAASTVTAAAPAPSLPHWVGARQDTPPTDACYRKSYIAKSKKCGTGYNFDNVATCWARCPLDYPVECGMECIPQNKDCAKEVLSKVTAVANVALNAATSGIFGQLTTAAKGVQTGVLCGQQLFAAVTKVTEFIEEVENGGKVDTTKEQLLFLLSKSDFVVYDLPVAVATCLGMSAPQGLSQVKEVVDVVKTVLDKIVNSKLSGVNLRDIKSFLNFTSSVPEVSKSVQTLPPQETDALINLLNAGISCGPELKSVIDRVIAAVQTQKTAAPTSTVDVIKFSVLNSKLILVDLPAAVSGCVDATGYKSRDDILKAVHEIIDKVISASSENDSPVPLDRYGITVAKLGLDAIAVFDPTGIAAMAAKFVQPICGPTVFIGDIDDGPAQQALGLNTIEKAFRGTTGTWKKQGNGLLSLVFKSVDDKDVKVNILSGGRLKYQVKVGKGETVAWSKPLSEFAGDTLYMDRWRAGFLGIPGSGGGSVLAWVPNDHDGQMDLTVTINPTSFSDHALRH